ncbi:MAG: metallophosphoesterase [Saprospiraceae bacterium]|nr:metallophosphoesterase [Saprospiraceae bacterium]
MKEALLGVSLLFLIACQNDLDSEIPDLPGQWQWDTCTVPALQVNQPAIPDSSWLSTEIPHRLLLPDHAIWYAAKVTTSSQHYLHIEADDGAQVFYDGKKYPAVNGYYYDLPQGEESKWLSIRVLNNAMEGGLKNVEWIRKEDVNEVWSEQNAVLEQLEEIYLSDLYRTDVFLPPDNFELHDRTSTKFTVWGDSQGGWAKFQSLCYQMLYKTKLEFSIGLGDLVSDGVSTAQWFSFMTCLAPLIEKRVLVFPVAGNHDYDGYYDDLIPRNYIRHILGKERPTYSIWKAGPAVFMALDPNGTFPIGLDRKQVEWAIDKMNSQVWQEATWRFVLIHQPPYAQGWPGYQGDNFIRRFIDENAEKYRIDFVLSGHCHDFEYLKKDYGYQQTYFIISGGGGGHLEPEENDNQIKMDTVISTYHYLLFDLDDRNAHIQLFNDQNHELWNNTIRAPKP